MKEPTRMIEPPHAPEHPVRRLIRWIVIALLAAGLVRVVLQLAAS